MIRVGETVVPAYVDQSRDALDGKKTVWEEISDGADMLTLGKRQLNSRSYVASFNLKGADQQKRVADLSGGERNRVHLAKLLKRGGNLLLLDEPTNDLDVDTLRALEDALLDVRGLRRRDQPRPVVPGPHRDPHPRVRGRGPRGLVRGQATPTTRRTGRSAWGPRPTGPTASASSGSSRPQRAGLRGSALDGAVSTPLALARRPHPSEVRRGAHGA